MPTYQYECEKCRKNFDVHETIGEHAQQRAHPCPRCGNRRTNQQITTIHVQTGRKT